MTFSARKIVKSYHQRRVVNEVSISVDRAEIVGLLGPNGAGKTTTFYTMVGLVRPDSGAIYLEDQDVTQMPMYKRARAGIGYLPQESSIFRKLTVEENIRMLWEVVPVIPPEKQDERLHDLLESLGLTALRKSKGVHLSGGERRRVEIARTLAMEPAFILLDEPFAGIDPIAVGELQEIIKQLKSMNYGIIITDHNVREMLSIIDRAYVIHQGEVLVSGSSHEVANSQTAKTMYLGEEFKI